MKDLELDQKIANFMGRKAAQFPDLELMDRGGVRTVKYDRFTQPAFGRF